MLLIGQIRVVVKEITYVWCRDKLGGANNILKYDNIGTSGQGFWEMRPKSKFSRVVRWIEDGFNELAMLGSWL